MLNQSTEDYIKSIYKLGKRGKSVGTSELAKHLNIGDGSVTDMMKKLSERKLIHYVPYQGVNLTESGRRLAMKMMRRHRLWEMFLVQHLGYTWDEVHEEAECLEHVTSDELDKRLDKMLGYPKVDPHGDPIPTADGVLVELNYQSLDECKAGEKYVVVRVSDESPEALQYLDSVGLRLNTTFLIKQRIEFDGSVIVQFKKKHISLSRQMAKNIFVQKL
jgi:DtxR family Mn-dependent transcriptional regulator